MNLIRTQLVLTSYTITDIIPH